VTNQFLTTGSCPWPGFRRFLLGGLTYSHENVLLVTGPETFV
jgi:hypothetical protein